MLIGAKTSCYRFIGIPPANELLTAAVGNDVLHSKLHPWNVLASLMCIQNHWADVICNTKCVIIGCDRTLQIEGNFESLSWSWTDIWNNGRRGFLDTWKKAWWVEIDWNRTIMCKYNATIIIITRTFLQLGHGEVVSSYMLIWLRKEKGLPCKARHYNLYANFSCSDQEDNYR